MRTEYLWSPDNPARTRSEAVTDGVRVTVVSYFSPQHSAADQGRYVFAYRIRISNEGPAAIRVMRRRWIITDGVGHRHEVKGTGVVGEQPRLVPGESFEYQSSVPLPTNLGFMRGTYEVIDDDNQTRTVKIDEFALVAPGLMN